MALSDRLKNATPSQPGLPCKIGRILVDESLTIEDRQALQDALDAQLGDPARLSNIQLTMALRDESYDVSTSAVTLHRRRACRCYGLRPKFDLLK